MHFQERVLCVEDMSLPYGSLGIRVMFVYVCVCVCACTHMDKVRV